MSETQAERRERIAAMVFAQMVNDEGWGGWEKKAKAAIEGANALIEALDAAAEADTKGEVTT
jgi:hypothetical protein